MKRVVIVIALMSTLAAAAPANAQFFSPQFMGHWNIRAIQQNLQNRIRIGAQNGSLDRREVNRLQDQFNRIVDLEQRMRRGGISLDERQRLEEELEKLSANIYRESRDGDFLGSTPWGWINTPEYRPYGLDDWRFNTMNWDNRPWYRNDSLWFNQPAWTTQPYWANRPAWTPPAWTPQNNWNSPFWSNQSNWNNRQFWNNQPANNNRRDDQNINRQQRSLAERIQQGRRDGSLNTDELARLRNRMRNIEQQESRMRANGLNQSERSQLGNQLNRLGRQIRRDRRD